MDYMTRMAIRKIEKEIELYQGKLKDLNEKMDELKIELAAARGHLDALGYMRELILNPESVSSEAD